MVLFKSRKYRCNWLLFNYRFRFCYRLYFNNRFNHRTLQITGGTRYFNLLRCCKLCRRGAGPLNVGYLGGELDDGAIRVRFYYDIAFVPVGAWLGTAKAKDRVAGLWRGAEPLHTWLVKHTSIG